MRGHIVRLQLGRIQKRIAENHRIPFTFDDEVVKLIVSRCTEVESGPRAVDAILTNTVLPAISEELLLRLMQGKEVKKVKVGVAKGNFRYRFD